MNKYNVEVRKTEIAYIEVEAVDETIAKMFAKHEAEKLGPGDWVRVGKLRIGDPVKISGVSKGESAYIAELPDDYHKIAAEGVTIKEVTVVDADGVDVTVEFADGTTTKVSRDLIAATVTKLLYQVEDYANDLERDDLSKHIFERHRKLLDIRDTLEAEGDM